MRLRHTRSRPRRAPCFRHGALPRFPVAPQTPVVAAVFTPRSRGDHGPDLTPNALKRLAFSVSSHTALGDKRRRCAYSCFGDTGFPLQSAVTPDR